MSRIEQVITEIEEFVERCKTVALSNSIYSLIERVETGNT